MSSPAGQWERVCCFRKLKACLGVFLLVFFTLSFMMLAFVDNDDVSTWQNEYRQRYKRHFKHDKSWDSVYQLNSSTKEAPASEDSQNMDKDTNAKNEQDKSDTKQQVFKDKSTTTFLDRIQPSKIPFNRSAFGNKYRLNKTRSGIYDFPFIIDGNKICSQIKEPFLVITILSVHTHIDTRLAIRNTWGRASFPGVWPLIGDLKQKVRLVFLFGNPKNELGNKIVAEESRMYGDIVQADFTDSYFNLTYKTITGIRWVAEHCPGAKYILKADEDVFVHVHNLINFLLKQDPSKRVIYGHTLHNSDVFREGRWGVAEEAYPLPVYPTYTCGNTYVIHGAMATDLYYTAGLLPYLNIEDVFVTGILRLFVKGDIYDVIGFTHWFEKRPQPCEFKNSVRISATKVTDYIQHELWEGLRSKKLADCYKIVRVIHNRANRPEKSVIEQKLIRDDHIYYNETSKLFYIL